MRREEPDARRRRRSRRRRRGEACEEECARDGLVGVEDERRSLQSPDVWACACVRICVRTCVCVCARVFVCLCDYYKTARAFTGYLGYPPYSVQPSKGACEYSRPLSLTTAYAIVIRNT